jgi:hypothetical protein
MCVDCEREYERARWARRTEKPRASTGKTKRRGGRGRRADAEIPLGPFLTVEQLVERYGGVWAPAVLRRHARAGMLPHIKFPGRKEVLFPLADLERFEAGQVDLEMVTLPHGGRMCRPRL